MIHLWFKEGLLLLLLLLGAKQIELIDIQIELIDILRKSDTQVISLIQVGAS
jgi:hypothetical protein